MGTFLRHSVEVNRRCQWLLSVSWCVRTVKGVLRAVLKVSKLTKSQQQQGCCSKQSEPRLWTCNLPKVACLNSYLLEIYFSFQQWQNFTVIWYDTIWNMYRMGQNKVNPYWFIASYVRKALLFCMFTNSETTASYIKLFALLLILNILWF